MRDVVNVPYIFAALLLTVSAIQRLERLGFLRLLGRMQAQQCAAAHSELA
jgi:hypothetical protein